MEEIKRKKRIVDDLDFRKDEDGQAAVEFVIITPVVLFIIITIIWTFDYQTFKQDASIEARNTTWNHAVNVAKTSGGAADSDELNALEVPFAGIPIASIRNAVRIGSFFYPDTLNNMASIETVLAGGALFNPFNNFSIFETASLVVNNFHRSGGAFRHTSPWNRILFGLGNFYDDAFDVPAGAGAWPPAEEFSFGHENYPMVTFCWEAYEHNVLTWDNSYDNMRQRITGDSGGFLPSVNTLGLEVSSQNLGFAGFQLWEIGTALRSPKYKFNKANFNFNADRDISNFFNLGTPFIDDDGAPQFNTEHPDDAHNRIDSITGQNRVREVTK